MKVLHFQHNGVGVIISKALRELGVESRVLATSIHPFGFKEDYLLKKNPWLRGSFKKFGNKMAWRPFYNFDLLHSHDNFRLPNFVLKRWHKKFIQHYHDPKIKYPLYEGVPSLVSLPTLLKVIPDATWMPLPVDTNYFKPLEINNKSHINVGYCIQSIDPSKKKYIPIKGIEAAAKKHPAKISLKPLTDVIPHDLMPKYYNQIDVWVDRIGHNFYGLSAIEVASMGKPVITQLGEEEKEIVPQCPFLDSTFEDVTDVLFSLAEDEQLRKSLGKKARDYVIEVHESIKVAMLCIEKYKEVLEN